MSHIRKRGTGNLYRVNNSWYLRFDHNAVDDEGKIVRKKKCVKLANVSDCENGRLEDLVAEKLAEVRVADIALTKHWPKGWDGKILQGQMYTPQQVAMFMKVRIKTLDAWRLQKQRGVRGSPPLVWIKLGGRGRSPIRYRGEDVLAFINQQREQLRLQSEAQMPISKPGILDDATIARIRGLRNEKRRVRYMAKHLKIQSTKGDQ